MKKIREMLSKKVTTSKRAGSLYEKLETARLEIVCEIRDSKGHQKKVLKALGKRVETKLYQLYDIMMIG